MSESELNRLLAQLKENPALIQTDPDFARRFNQALGASNLSSQGDAGSSSASATPASTSIPNSPPSSPIPPNTTLGSSRFDGVFPQQRQPHSAIPTRGRSPLDSLPLRQPSRPNSLPSALPSARRTPSTSSNLPFDGPLPSANPSGVSHVSVPPPASLTSRADVPVPNNLPKSSAPFNIDSSPTTLNGAVTSPFPPVTPSPAPIEPSVAPLSAPFSALDTSGAFTTSPFSSPNSPSTPSATPSLPPAPKTSISRSADSLGDDSESERFLALLESRNVPSPENQASEEVALVRSRHSSNQVAKDASTWLFSLFVHLIILLILAFIVVNVDLKDRLQVISEPGFGDEVVLDEVFDPDAALETVEDVTFETTTLPEVEAEVADVPDVSTFNEETAAPLTMMETTLALDAAPVGAVENLLGSLTGDDLSGRGENKAAALLQGGGTEGSEKSVALALAWLAQHQRPDGSWSYVWNYHGSGNCTCKDSGTNKSTIAATSMGLLPFLAAGNTPTKGKYKRVVANGLNYLLAQGKEESGGFSFRDNDGGNMYAHGLATITLSETYAMLSSSERKRFAQLQYVVEEAVRYIESAQAVNGGWRYSPLQAGDTSVTGWVLMGLKSAEMANIGVRGQTLADCRMFLRDIVGKSGGVGYGYVSSEDGSLSTSAIGLLGRLFLDWRVDNPTLVQGATQLAGGNRDLNNPYYLYYASQLLHHIGGPVWKEWNQEIREKLIATQCMEGHERGSWFPKNPDGHCSGGGRLYATALNCLTLEVYYRHLPLNQKLEVSEAFVLDGPADAERAVPPLPVEEDDFPIEDFSDSEDNVDGADEP